MNEKKELHIVMVQENPTVGDLDGNIQKVITQLNNFPKADLIVFPECFITGYPLEDLVMRAGFMAKTNEALNKLTNIVKEKNGPAILIGTPVIGSDLPHNAAVLIRADGSHSVTLKTELPNFDVFDEKRVFSTTNTPPKPLNLKGWKLGVMVCEDMWHGNISRHLADELADVLIVLNGSPYEDGKHKIRIEHASRRAKDTNLPLIYVNMTGGQDEIVFDGASFTMDQNGNVLSQMDFCNVDIHEIILKKDDYKTEIDPNCNFTIDTLGARIPYPDRMESIYRACVTGLRDYIEKTNAQSVVLGVSGGIDSALVAAIAADAIGAENVTGIMMPSQYTGDESLDLADDLMKRIGMRSMVLPIKESVEAVIENVNKFTPKNAETLSLAQENIQARLRGMLLMAFSNAEGGIVLSTGNKSEMSVGYATLYGDMSGGFNPLKDIYKTDVWKLSKWRNAHIPKNSKCEIMEIITPEIIDRPPTAELKEDQSDEKSLGSYDVLDALLRGLIEEGLDTNAAKLNAENLLNINIEQEHAQRIANLVKNAEYKRRQAPPGVKLTAKSFGKGWRYPIINKSSF